MTRFPLVAAGAVTILVAGCAVDRAVGPTVGVDYSPTIACSPDSVVPQIVETHGADLPAAVWERRLAWDAQIRFRVDETGTPVSIHVHVPDATPDAEDIERASLAAFTAYRFCAPVAYPIHREWSANLRFKHASLPADIVGGEMMMQVFVPSYTRGEIQSGRVGTTSVVGTFGQDGKPRFVRVAKTSGDAVLDQKSLEAMSSEQFAFKPGTILSRPLTFEQPFTYVIR